MLRLVTFGGLMLTRDAVLDRSPASQRRRLALLALIAGSGRRGISRDKLLGLLWPASEEEQARQALSQAMHGVRRALEADDLFVGTVVLRLNADRVTSDVGEFDDAVAAADHERAASLYEGPFLDGVFLDGVPEFERWVDAERSRRAREYEAVLEALSGAARGRGDHAALVGWRQRHAAAEPLSARATVGLIEALVIAGDRAGALRAAQVHAELVRQELESEPEGSVIEWMNRLRTGGLESASTREYPSTAFRSPSPGHAHEGGGDRGDLIARALGDRYVIEGAIAEGKVVSTYAAREVRGGREVELNVLNQRMAPVTGAGHCLRVLERVAALASAHVVQMWDFGAAGDVVFYATPRVAARSLRERLARERPLPVDESLAIARDVALALACAHGHELYHGDLRPKHIVVSSTGAMLGALGVVEALGAQGGGGPSGTGVTIGAPAYLSPEQLTGEGVADARSDIYSLGCVLYEMLAGELPFGSDRYSSITRKLTHPAPSPRALREGVPEPFDRLVRKCLARVPADRYRSAEEVHAALEKVGEET